MGLTFVVLQLLLTTVQLVAHPVGHFVPQLAKTVSVAVRVQQASVIHGCVIVSICRQARRVQVRDVKEQEDQGAGVSTRVMKVGQERGARVVVVRVRVLVWWAFVMVVMWVVV